MRVTDTHVYFWGSCFSNFYKAETKINLDTGICDITDITTFPTSEHAYMAYKAVAFSDLGALFMLQSEAKKHPAEAKKIGRSVKNFNQKIWDQIKYDRMYKAVYAKFSQNLEIKKLLLDTETRTLVEASPIDKVWGVGLHYDDDAVLDDSNWKGENLLGRVLMDVRQRFWDEEDSNEWFKWHKETNKVP